MHQALLPARSFARRCQAEWRSSSPPFFSGCWACVRVCHILSVCPPVRLSACLHVGVSVSARVHGCLTSSSIAGDWPLPSFGRLDIFFMYVDQSSFAADALDSDSFSRFNRLA